MLFLEWSRSPPHNSVVVGSAIFNRAEEYANQLIHTAKALWYCLTVRFLARATTCLTFIRALDVARCQFT